VGGAATFALACVETRERAPLRRLSVPAAPGTVAGVSHPGFDGDFDLTRLHGHGRVAGAGIFVAGGDRPVARRGPVFEEAFRYFAAVRVDRPVEHCRGRFHRRRRFGVDRRFDDRQGFHRAVGAFGGPGGVRRADPVVVGRVGGQARQFGDRHRARGGSRRGGARRTRVDPCGLSDEATAAQNVWGLR
jgi:hypothetical protein